MTTITIPMSDGTSVDVPAEPTRVPGLYVTPAVPCRPEFRPEWRLTHGPSGQALPYWGRTPDHCHALASALAELRADWSDLPTDPDAWPDGLQHDINRVGGEWECRRHRRSQPEFFWPATTGASS